MQDALTAAAKHFPSIPKDNIVLQSDKLNILPGKLVTISSEYWQQAVVSLDSVFVMRSESFDGTPGEHGESAPSQRA